MLIRRQSILSGDVHTWDLPVTEDQIRRWESGELVQDVFPDLTADQREFILSGITPAEWAKMADDEEPDDPDFLVIALGPDDMQSLHSVLSALFGE